MLGAGVCVLGSEGRGALCALRLALGPKGGVTWREGGGGGALWYLMDTHYQTAARSVCSECRHLGTVSSFESGKNRGGGGQLQMSKLIGTATCKFCLFSLYFVNYIGIHCMDSFV